MWWEALSNFQQTTFIIALSATIILLIFLILLLMGIGDESFDGSDSELDFDGYDIYNDEPLSAFAGLRILSVRGVLSFLSIGGWTAFTVEPSLGVWWSLLIGVIAGVVAAYLLAIAFRLSLRLESSGNINYEYAIGKTATVYIRVPKSKSGKGKVNLILQERLIEVDAVTEEDNDLLTNTIVEIVSLDDERTFIVKRK